MAPKSRDDIIYMTTTFMGRGILAGITFKIITFTGLISLVGSTLTMVIFMGQPRMYLGFNNKLIQVIWLNNIVLLIRRGYLKWR